MGAATGGDRSTGDGPRRRWGDMLSGLAVAVGCVLFLGGFVWGALLYQPYTVPTDSMAPTIEAGDRVLAQRIDGGQVHRGDVVVFRDQVWGAVPMLKRVVGVGGDRVACCDGEGRLTVDGVPVAESYLPAPAPASPSGFEAVVPDGEIFLLGDHRSDSVDSRVHLADNGGGSVPTNAVDARVDATVWPLDSAGMLRRPPAFADLPGGVSQPGPLATVLFAVVAGAVLVFGGAAWQPLVRRMARSRHR